MIWSVKPSLAYFAPPFVNQPVGFRLTYEGEGETLGLPSPGLPLMREETSGLIQDFPFLLQNPRTPEGFQKGFLKVSLKGSLKCFRRVLEGVSRGPF